MDEEEKEEDLFVHATSEGGDASQVTFVDDCLVAVACSRRSDSGERCEVKRSAKK